MMKQFFLLFISALFVNNATAVCSSPISRTNNGTNSVLTSTKYNLDLNTVYNKVNNLPGDCITDASVDGSKLIDASIPAGKYEAGSIATADIADGAITAAKLAAAIDNLVPVGTVLMYGGTVAPSGYLLGQGQSLSRTTYAALYAVYGTAFGTADGNSFNNIDCRGRFARFVDGGQNRDPDRASRTAMNTGGNVGDNVGSIQVSTYEIHSHYSGIRSQSSTMAAQYGTGGYDGISRSYSNYTLGGPNTGWTQAITSSSGGNETRPLNFNVNCIVKY
jgi:microcystin-dependent protein